MANFVDPAAIAAVGNTSLETRDIMAARRLRARAQRYRLLARALSCQEAVDAAQECARALDADAARLEGGSIHSRVHLGTADGRS